ncbi:hypothetical protein ACIPMU_35420 [Streptomyces cyaneofuscatus]|uniref:hypothetical protein n=1 Tax=Streptomyces cyaneofuscatus TaxID=66883 RepID=UPI0038126317
MTDPPRLELADNDGSPACAWYFETAQDLEERIPFNQIVNLAVHDLQNIGDFSVWAYAKSVAHRDRPASDALRTATAERKKELAPLIPQGWRGTFDDWKDAIYQFEAKGEVRFREEHGTEHWKEGPRDLVAAMKKYMAEVLKGTTTAPRRFPDAKIAMYGAGARRGAGSTPRWTTDGSYIFGADSRTIESERTYWTDKDGILVGQTKGHAGQAWSIKPWTPPVTQKVNVNDFALTGLFGPLAAFL